MRIPQTPERIKEAPAQALRAVFAGVGQVLLMTERIRRKAMGQEHSHAVSSGGLDTHDAPAPAQDSGTRTATPARDQAGQVKTSTAGTSATATGTADTSATATGTAGPNSTATGSGPTSTAKSSTTKTSTTKASAAKTSTAKVQPVKAKPAKTKASSAKTSTTKAAATKPGPAEADSVKATATTKPGNAKADTAPAETATPAEAVAPAPPEVRGTGVLPVPHYSELSVASLRARLRGLDITQVRDLLTYERTHEDRANVIAMFERRIAKLEEAEGADPAAG